MRQFSRNAVREAQDSKVKFAEVITKLENYRGNRSSIRFSAKDVGISGNTLSVLAYPCYGLLKVVDTVECWYKIDDDTMKRGEAKVYEYDTDGLAFLQELSKYKYDECFRRVEACRLALREAEAELAKVSLGCVMTF